MSQYLVFVWQLLSSHAGILGGCAAVAVSLISFVRSIFTIRQLRLQIRQLQRASEKEQSPIYQATLEEVERFAKPSSSSAQDRRTRRMIVTRRRSGGCGSDAAELFQCVGQMFILAAIAIAIILMIHSQFAREALVGFWALYTVCLIIGWFLRHAAAYILRELLKTASRR